MRKSRVQVPFPALKKWLYNAVFEALINHKFFEGLKSTGKSTGIVKKIKIKTAVICKRIAAVFVFL